jgi:hypothetical protein
LQVAHYGAPAIDTRQSEQNGDPQRLQRRTPSDTST